MGLRLGVVVAAALAACLVFTIFTLASEQLYEDGAPAQHIISDNTHHHQGPRPRHGRAGSLPHGAQNHPADTNSTSKSGGHAGLCSASARDRAGSWQRPAAPRLRHAIYDQLSVFNNCHEPAWFAQIEPRFTKRSGCTTLDLLDAFSRLGAIPLHFAGDSLTRYTYLSLRWARRRAALEARFCGNRSPELMQLGDTSGGVRRWFWSVLRGSQGMEGDYVVPVGIVSAARKWLGWEGTDCHGYCHGRRFDRTLGMTYTPWVSMMCTDRAPEVGVFTYRAENEPNLEVQGLQNCS